MNKIFLLLLFLTSSLSAATITRYVNPGSSGGDGTTSALTGANAAYASLNAWEAAENANLTDNGGDIMVVNCAGTTADTTGIIISGWFTSASCYIQIIGDNTTGKESTSFYRIRQAASIPDHLQISEGWVFVKNVEFDGSGATSDAYPCIRLGSADNANDEIRISNCIFHDNAYSGGVRITSGNMLLKVWNCIFYNMTGATTGIGIDYQSTNNGGLAYNCTVYGSTTGYKRTNGTLTLKNCIGNSNTDNYSGTITTTYCASDTASELSGTGDRSGTTGDVAFVNVGAGTEDFHLGATDVNAIDLGTNDPGSGLFADDIDGVTRSGTWDIGADEYVSGEAPPAGAPYSKPIIFCE